MTDQHAADVESLLARASRANSFRLNEEERDTGASSNSIVAIAYGALSLSLQEMPNDMDDLMACRRMWNKLPEHRKTQDAIEAMARANLAVKR